MLCCVVVFSVFFFKQKTAYEMRISDWSSDVVLFRSTLEESRPAASQLVDRAFRASHAAPQYCHHRPRRPRQDHPRRRPAAPVRLVPREPAGRRARQARKRVVSGKRVSVRVDLGGRRNMKKKTQHTVITVTFSTN